MAVVSLAGALAAATGCGSSDDPPENGGSGGSGATTASGGASSSGGTAASGGSDASGGTSASGGSDASGGAPASGGTTSPDGGGGTPPASGGAAASGGTASGGAASGGAPATGGAPPAPKCGTVYNENPTCNTCMESKCCNELKACGPDSPCERFLKCAVDNCPTFNSSCLQAACSSFASGAQPVSDLISCREDCVDACPLNN